MKGPRKKLAGILVSFVLLQGAGATVGGCTTTYTEADVRKKEARDEAQARDEEKRDRRIGEEGGANEEAGEEERERMERDADR